MSVAAADISVAAAEISVEAVGKMLSPPLQKLQISAGHEEIDERGGGGDPARSSGCPQVQSDSALGLALAPLRMKHRRSQSHELSLATMDLSAPEKKARQHVSASALAQLRENHIALVGRASRDAQVPTTDQCPTSSVPVSPIQSPQRERALPSEIPSATVLLAALLAPPAAPPGVAATTEKRVPSPPRLPSAAQLAAWPKELTKPLPAAVVARMLLDSRYQPGHRPEALDPLDGRFVFKECSFIRKHCPQGDRWHNSGGKAGARDMKVEGAAVRVRRRYGSITRNGCISWRFHEYSLVRQVSADPATQIDPTKIVPKILDRTADELMAVAMIASMAEKPAATPHEEWVEDRTTSVFHVMPSRPRRGRPKRGEESDQAALWGRVAPGLTWELSETCISSGGQTAGRVMNAVCAAV